MNVGLKLLKFVLFLVFFVLKFIYDRCKKIVNVNYLLILFLIEIILYLVKFIDMF